MSANDEAIQAAVELALIKREAEELKRQNEKLKQQADEKEQQATVSHQDLVALREKLEGFMRAKAQDDANLKMEIIKLQNHISDIESRTAIIGKGTLGRAFAVWGNNLFAQIIIAFGVFLFLVFVQMLTGRVW